MRNLEGGAVLTVTGGDGHEKVTVYLLGPVLGQLLLLNLDSTLQPLPFHGAKVEAL